MNHSDESTASVTQSNSILHFARFEFKYLLSDKLRKEIESELQYFMTLDPFVEGRSDSQYFVRSLYFDDPTYSAYFDKMEGLHSRSKFRIRTYADESDKAAPCFLEIKGRHNNLVYKHRVELGFQSDSDWSDKTDLIKATMASEKNNPILAQFEFDLMRKRLRPCALIDYQRRPYISIYDSEFRLTFDSDLRAWQSETLTPKEFDRTRCFLPGYTILEVKFRHQIPSWFHRILQSYEMERRSISKICWGLEALDLVSEHATTKSAFYEPIDD